MSARELEWRKSTRSSDDANCVEVAWVDRATAVRDSKNTGPVLTFPTEAWARLVGK